MAAALALGVVLLANGSNRPRLSIVITVMTILGLLIYKVAAVG